MRYSPRPLWLNSARMIRPLRWKLLSAMLTSLLLPAAVSLVVAQGPANTSPVLDDPLKEGTVDKVLPTLPVGKGLVMPIAASDVDGDALSYTVTSSNPKIHVRARTAQPHLKLAVRHASSGAGDVAFEGELDFQVLRQWTPETAGFINGFAQSNYYLPRPEGTGTRHTIFHRVIKGFMCQTGDPNGHTRNVRDGAQTISHGPGFNFDDEFHPGVIFTGRGQMAMANAGFDGFYNGSNNSQWFVTVGPQRHLDFNHTIFGQLVRGWDLLDKMNNVRLQDQPTRTDLPAGTPDDPEKNSSPITPIEITGATVVPNFTDAVLVITAEAPGTSTISVAISDGKGGTATQSFTVTAEHDGSNSPPFFAQFPLDGPLSATNGEAFALRALDLEDDYLFTSSLTLTGDAVNQVVGNSLQVFPVKRSGTGTAPTTGKHLVGMNTSQYDMTGASSGGTDDQRSATFVIGEKPITAEGIPVSGAPGIALTASLASFSDADARGDKSGYGARINWGDGSTPALASAAEIVRDPSQPNLVAYHIKGTHTYSRAGTYNIKVSIESTTGLKKTVRTIAVISESPVKVFGEAITAQGARVANQVLATIEDSAAATDPSLYSARVNWGDGTATVGTVKRAGSGQLFVTGTHDYRDTDSYSVLVEVTKAGTVAPVVGWATVRAVNAKAPRFLPPFSKARIISDIAQVTTKKGAKALLTTVGSGLNEQTMATLGLVVISYGGETVPASSIRFYLSADRNFNLENEEYEDSSVQPPVTRINPKDIPVTIGKNKKALKIIPLKRGVSGQLDFDKTSTDTRIYLPKGEPGLGYYLLAHFDYKEPLVAPGERFAVEDLGSPISVIGRDTPRANDSSQTVELMENAGSFNVRSFKVRIARRPSSEVKIPLSIVGSFGQQDPSEFYFTAKPPAEGKYLTESPDHEVIFTPEMWDQGTKEQEVSLTVKNDNVAETGDQRLSVRIGGAKSNDPLFQNRVAGPLSVYVRDENANVTISRTALTTKEPNVNGTFEIALRSPLPLAGRSVSIKLTSGNPAEGKLAIGNGTPANEVTVVLNAATSKATIQVVAQDDLVDEATNPQYTITVHPTVSDDPDYHNVNPPDITVTNEDNE